jgi:hypothetical protein
LKKKVEQKIAIGNLLLSSPLFRLAAPKHPLFCNPPIELLKISKIVKNFKLKKKFRLVKVESIDLQLWPSSE